MKISEAAKLTVSFAVIRRGVYVHFFKFRKSVDWNRHEAV